MSAMVAPSNEGASEGRSILVTGGAGYIGALLVPKLLQRHRVTVLDTFLFGDKPLSAVATNPKLTLVRGDIRDTALLDSLLGSKTPDVVIHLAAISNDPCSEIDPELTLGINLHATSRLMQLAKQHGVSRFINASSASVYGLKDEHDVTEDLSLEPMTLYAKCKADTETVLNGLIDDRFCGVSVRSATVCGYTKRLRLDLTVNILTYHAVEKGEIKVFGGTQMRPNIHVEDLTDFYVQLVHEDASKLNGRAFNVSTENSTVAGIAELVRAEVDPGLPIVTVPTQDNRSYHLSAARAKAELGFAPQRSLSQAVRDLVQQFRAGNIPNPGDAWYRNIEVMKDPEAMKAMAFSEAGR
jgi:nucleoside-diphosphate-sugar epimerase